MVRGEEMKGFDKQPYLCWVSGSGKIIVLSSQIMHTYTNVACVVEFRAPSVTPSHGATNLLPV